MQNYRRGFGTWIGRITGGLGGGGASLAAGPSPDIQAVIGWAVVFVLAIIGSFLFPRYLEPFWAQMAFAALWGAFIGLTLLFFFLREIIITIIGTILGVSGSAAAGVGQIVQKIADIDHAMMAMISAEIGKEVTVYQTPGWVFLITLGLPCILAYRG
jgi:hypothetical protein